MLYTLMFFIVLTATPAIASADMVSKGKELYEAYGCALCHGKHGQGDGMAASRYYPPPTNFYDLRTYKYGSTKKQMALSVQFGTRNGAVTAMPAFKDIPQQELDQIVAYLASLQPKSSSSQEKK